MNDKLNGLKILLGQPSTWKGIFMNLAGVGLIGFSADEINMIVGGIFNIIGLIQIFVDRD